MDEVLRYKNALFITNDGRAYIENAEDRDKALIEGGVIDSILIQAEWEFTPELDQRSDLINPGNHELSIILDAGTEIYIN